ncbi:helix-turn-helix domain-containing protein [Polaribacter litorisediminis]|uniref:helix-turn-helix domain-containing protein n=1 Tax=Polaribacter litorisediminis TaxID=1908341 RepID=UPI001CBDDBC8|nr:helix-turn-helix domain-containing protein [Polaribacter litorisediminis]UAM97019.1 helix-turn-helix domain-containing protein [Polaribacter litorisediminis]
MKKRIKIEKQDKIDFPFKKVDNSEIDTDLVTVKQTMEILNISRGSVRNWTDNGDLIKHAIGGRVYYKRSELSTVPKKLK